MRKDNARFKFLLDLQERRERARQRPHKIRKNRHIRESDFDHKIKRYDKRHELNK